MGRIKYSVFCTAIFSASDPLRSSRMRLWMSDCRFTQRDLNNRTGYTAVSSIHGWCHVKLLPFRRTFCVHHTAGLMCYFIRSHIRRVYACLAVTCHTHWMDLLLRKQWRRTGTEIVTVKTTTIWMITSTVAMVRIRAAMGDTLNRVAVEAVARRPTRHRWYSN